MSFERVPNYTALRLSKEGYATRFPIDAEHPLYKDPLVDPRDDDFGFTDASSYYSKPNSMTGEVLPGVPDAPLVRLDVALRLKRAEEFLRSDQNVREALGAPARLRIDDALRPYSVQKFAFEVAWPMVIKHAHPELTDEQVREQVYHYCAEPKEPTTATPHLTGGAVDVALINVDTDEAFNRGHIGGKVKGTAFPDFHEGYHMVPGQSNIDNSEDQEPVAPDNGEIVLGRRILYYAMTKIAGLHVNPEEIWHYGKGDPLSEYVSGSNHPYYGIATLPNWYDQQMRDMQQ
ncbi:MAG TPA: hypothetical protein VFI84_04585 [Candidatus Saccharimonadales bacterium]|nr:hypothetical protein [Candidatus Saccharimonadales bacterium]